MKKFIQIILILLILVLLAAIGFVGGNFAASKFKKTHNPIVTMEIEGYGTVKIELYPEYAPNTVKNFITLAQRGYYNGKTFNDIEDGLVRGGLSDSGPKLSDIQDNVTDDYEYTINGEFVQAGYNDNTFSHSKGTISMYRSTYGEYQQQLYMLQMVGYSEFASSLTSALYDSQSSEFFITTKDYPSLNGLYTAFGKVIDGMDIIEKISALELQTTIDEDDGHEHKTTKPVNPPVITKVEVNTYGVKYDLPEVQEKFDIDGTINSILNNYMSTSASF